VRSRLFRARNLMAGCWGTFGIREQGLGNRNRDQGSGGLRWELAMKKTGQSGMGDGSMDEAAGGGFEET